MPLNCIWFLKFVGVRQTCEQCWVPGHWGMARRQVGVDPGSSHPRGCSPHAGGNRRGGARSAVARPCVGQGPSCLRRRSLGLAPGRLGPHVIRVKQYSPEWREAAGWHRGGNRDLQVVDFTEALPDYLRLPAMTAKLRQFLADESGATAIEYSLIAGGIALAIIATVKGIGPKLNTTFSSISSQLK